MHTFNYFWDLEALSYSLAKEWILDLGFTDQSSTVQMRRAFYALLGLVTKCRTTFCGTLAHGNRIKKALNLLHERAENHQKKEFEKDFFRL